MKHTVKMTAVIMAAIMLLAFPLSSEGWAAATDYKFELVDTSFKAGDKVPVRIRLSHVATGKTVDDATLDEPKLTMSMPGMGDMDGHAERLSTDKDGNFRVAADLVHGGEWFLLLTAHVPGENDLVEGKLTLQVTGE
jgi:hypothetical protein